MNVRALLIDTGEFIYPDSTNFDDMSVFYGMLKGYEIKGHEIRVDKSSGMKDKNDKEIYENDLVELNYLHEELSDMMGKDKENGWVHVDGACFTIMNEDGLLWEVTDASETGEKFSMEVIGSLTSKKVFI